VTKINTEYSGKKEAIEISLDEEIAELEA